MSETLCPDTDAFEPLGRDVQCTACERILSRRTVHLPNRRGAFGWIEHYADGSTYTVPPGQTPKNA